MNLRRVSQRWQLAVLPGLLVAVLAAGVLWLDHALLQRGLCEHSAQHLQHMAEYPGQLLGRAIDRRVQELQLLARDPALRLHLHA